MENLVAFDFDSTLIHTPTPESGKEHWEKETGSSWAGRGWWGNPESLNLNIFYPPVNQWVYKFYKQYSEDTNSHCFLATGRVEKLRGAVIKVLKLHDIDIDLYCNPGMDTYLFKARLFTNLIDRYKPKKFIMFDDRHEHLVKFVNEWAPKQKVPIEIIDVINKKKLI